VAHFLAPLFAAPPDTCPIVNERLGVALATRVSGAFDSRSRRRGVLGRDSMATGTALAIAPCSAIHTFFMRFPIDVIFANRDGVVVKVCRNVRPWRIAFAWGAFAAIEFAAGEAVQSTSTAAGDRLRIVPR
jgi:uncharacterized protein